MRTRWSLLHSVQRWAVRFHEKDKKQLLEAQLCFAWPGRRSQYPKTNNGSMQEPRNHFQGAIFAVEGCKRSSCACDLSFRSAQALKEIRRCCQHGARVLSQRHDDAGRIMVRDVRIARTFGAGECFMNNKSASLLQLKDEASLLLADVGARFNLAQFISPWTGPQYLS